MPSSLITVLSNCRAVSSRNIFFVFVIVSFYWKRFVSLLPPTRDELSIYAAATSTSVYVRTMKGKYFTLCVGEILYVYGKICYVYLAV